MRSFVTSLALTAVLSQIAKGKFCQITLAYCSSFSIKLLQIFKEILFQVIAEKTYQRFTFISFQVRDLKEKENSLLPRSFCQNVREVSGLRIKVFAKHCQKLFIKSCVGRNFCDISGSVTQTRNNRLRFGDDHRGLVVRKWENESGKINDLIIFYKNCVDKKKNRLGVCCFDRRKLSIFNRRRVRQDEIQVSDNHLLSYRQRSHYYLCY